MKYLCGFLLFLVSMASHADTFSADIVVKNGVIRTMDKKSRVVQSMAVHKGKIVALGSDGQTKVMVGPNTRVIDANGKLVLPGFNDAHVHFVETGLQLNNVDLRGAKSPEEMVARLKAYARLLPKGRWIRGGRWDHENWKPSELPTAKMIDAATPENPVFIARVDGHMALANSLAMKLAGVSSSTPDLDGGVIVRNAQRNPTGVFKDAAMTYIEKSIPALSLDEVSEAAQKASDHAASLGVTSVQDMSGGTSAGVYQELAKLGKLKTRIYGCSPLPDYERIAKKGEHRALGDAFVRVGCLKGFADGSLGSRTAWLFEPYLDDKSSTGLAGEEVKDLPREVEGADKAQLQIMIHAIGDKANATVLDLFSIQRGKRARIEHAQHVRAVDIPRFAQLGVIASMQPTHAIDDGRWANKRLDPARLKTSYAWRSLIDQGAVLAFGSDSPVVSLDPLLGIYAAVTRRTLDDKNPNGWVPEQKITVEEAVRAFTWGSAYAEFQDDVKGTLEVGKLADFVILSDDIFKIAPERIRDVKVVKTVINGRVVFERP